MALSSAEHTLRPAGPAPSDLPADAAENLPRGSDLRLTWVQCSDRMPQPSQILLGLSEEEPAMKHVSPEADPGTNSWQLPSHSAACRLASPDHAQRRQETYLSHHSELFDRSESRLQEEATPPVAQLQLAPIGHKPAAADGLAAEATSGCYLEQPQHMQVSRRGRGRAIGRAGRTAQGLPLFKALDAPATLDSGRFGFVRLPSSRFAHQRGIHLLI